jgi:hypothetical protein
MHVDSDDWLMPNALGTYSANAKRPVQMLLNSV